MKKQKESLSMNTNLKILQVTQIKEKFQKLVELMDEIRTTFRQCYSYIDDNKVYSIEERDEIYTRHLNYVREIEIYCMNEVNTCKEIIDLWENTLGGMHHEKTN